MRNILFPDREVTYLQLMNLLLMVLVVALSFIDIASGMHMAALVGTTVFALTLIPARLLGLKWLRPIDGDLLQIARNGKWLGIWTCVWYCVYASLAFTQYYGLQFVPSEFIHRETVLLTMSLVIFVVLLSLSNKWSYAHVKWWKQINMLIWMTVPFLFTHFLLAGKVFNNVDAFVTPLVILALMVIAGVSGVFRTQRDYFAWWRIGMMLLATVISVLVTWFYPAIL